MFGRLDGLITFLTYDIFSLQWIYWDITPWQGKEYVCMVFVYACVDVCVMSVYNL